MMFDSILQASTYQVRALRGRMTTFPAKTLCFTNLMSRSNQTLLSHALDFRFVNRRSPIQGVLMGLCPLNRKTS